jgi:cobalt-precorrin-5B (C1)-methyltransferase
VESKSKKLRSGYTTGACAAAAAKAATLYLLRNAEACTRVYEWNRECRVCGMRNEGKPERIDIPFPDGSRAAFAVHASGFNSDRKSAWASVIKDAGDDPDITNGAEIAAEVRHAGCDASGNDSDVIIRGGKGVGTVTKPGLALPVGEPAINPVPRKMIRDAVSEAIKESGLPQRLETTISVPNGEHLAKKTLNNRLGIIGGISILGTTGIVKPLSEAAWTATISACFDVAKALQLDEVVISTGRTSEKAHQNKYNLPVEAYAMMGDYAEFSLRDARRRGFRRVHLCAQWAKMIKIGMGTPQTHVRHGAIEAAAAAEFLESIGLDIPRNTAHNTVRELYECIKSGFREPGSAFTSVCEAAQKYCETITGGIPVSVHLVSYEGEIVAEK